MTRTGGNKILVGQVRPSPIQEVPRRVQVVLEVKPTETICKIRHETLLYNSFNWNLHWGIAYECFYIICDIF